MSRLIEHIKLSEGVKYKTYLDTVGKLTGGVGHLLTPREQKLYPLGTVLSEHRVDFWLDQDLKKAIKAAEDQMIALKLSNESLFEALVSVNFQLGQQWIKKFPMLWSKLKLKDYDGAVQEALYTREGSTIHSSWYKQTPARVKDFVDAIRKL